MNYYFLLNLIGLTGSVTLANFAPSNQRKIYNELIVHAIYADGQHWQCHSLTNLKYNQTITVQQSDLPDRYINQTCFLFLHPKKQPFVLESLITDSLFQKSQPVWRANIKIRSAFTATSYQGEYPSSMASVSKPSLLSYAPILQKAPNVTNELILINMTLLPTKKPHKIFIVNSKKQILKECVVYTNEHNLINLDDVLTYNEPLITLSNQFMGVPIYFSKTADCRQMSIEHTHPPAEYVSFGDRGYFQRSAKTWCFNEPFIHA